MFTLPHLIKDHSVTLLKLTNKPCEQDLRYFIEPTSHGRYQCHFKEANMEVNVILADKSPKVPGNIYHRQEPEEKKFKTEKVPSPLHLRRKLFSPPEVN